MFKRKKKNTQPNDKSQDYWSYVKRQFRKNKRALYSMYVVMFLAVIAIFADFISYDKPIVAKYNDQWYMPVFKDYGVKLGVTTWKGGMANFQWQDSTYQSVVWPLIPYLPENLDYKAKYVGPFDEQADKTGKWRHWLGTDELGRDVAAGMIHGTRIAFMVGIVAMGIASFIGILLGALAGFFGDDLLKVSRIRFWLNLLFLFLAFYYGFFIRGFTLSDAFQVSVFNFLGQLLLSFIIFGAILWLGNLLAKPLEKVSFLKKQIPVPVDLIITRLIEILKSIPLLIIIIAFLAIAKPSIINTMIVIGAVSWTGIARFIRAELLRIRSLEYIEAAHALGFSRLRTMFRHAIPNGLSPVFISIAFGIAAAILIEATLSFLGIGVPVETITWGKMLSFSRKAASAWWLAVFPGFAIFITVTLFNLIGEGLTDALDPRLKQ